MGTAILILMWICLLILVVMVINWSFHSTWRDRKVMPLALLLVLLLVSVGFMLTITILNEPHWFTKVQTEQCTTQTYWEPK